MADASTILIRIGIAALAAIAGIALFAAAAVALVAARSPGEVRPFVDEGGKTLPGSIAEKRYLSINGAEQAVFIKGKDAAKPVLLYLHGGMPDYFLTEGYPTGLEDLFTVAWWEQRGSGISYDPGADLPITLDLMVRDTLAVADYLRSRFGVDKVYLMAHSGGTFIGANAAARAPEKFAAYIAVSQMVDTRESEVLAYEYMLGAYRDAGKRGKVRLLERYPVTREGGVPPEYQMARDVSMHELGIGTMRSMRSILTGLVVPSLTFPEYSLKEKYRFWAAKAASGISALWKEAMETDVARSVPRLDLPVYFFHGAYDYTCSYPLARRYLESLEAPVKGFYTFPESAHSPLFEEPGLMRRIIESDVLTGRADLADR